MYVARVRMGKKLRWMLLQASNCTRFKIEPDPAVAGWVYPMR